MADPKLKVLATEYDDLTVRESARRARREPDEPPPPEGVCAAELMEREMPPIHYNADPWIPEGLNILAGRPKLGKSTMARQKAAAIAGGGDLWGVKCAQGEVALLWLEEGDRLARAKFEQAGFPRDALRSITLFFEWPRGTDGVLQLCRLLDARPAIKYVVIDSLTRFRAPPDARTPAFQADYMAVSELHAVAKAHPGLSIDLIHHTRKAKSDDPLDDISGTYGLSAACDSYHVMRHHEDGAVLHVGGRLWDRDETQFELRRERQRWELVGEFTGLSLTQRQTLDALRAHNRLTPTQGADIWGGSRQAAHKRLDGLCQLGVAFAKDGTYYPK